MLLRRRRGKTDQFLADLAVRWPGVRHMLAVDPHQAAEHVVNLTIALGLQPYKAQVWLPCMSNLCIVLSLLKPHNLVCRTRLIVWSHVRKSCRVYLFRVACCTQRQHLQL